MSCATNPLRSGAASWIAGATSLHARPPSRNTARSGPTKINASGLLFYPLRFLIAAILVQCGVGGAAIRARLEGELRVHGFDEEFLFSFCEDLEFLLVGGVGRASRRGRGLMS